MTVLCKRTCRLTRTSAFALTFTLSAARESPEVMLAMRVMPHFYVAPSKWRNKAALSEVSRSQGAAGD